VKRLTGHAILAAYLAGPARRFAGATDNEAALLAFHSQGPRMEALRAHNFRVRRASA